MSLFNLGLIDTPRDECDIVWERHFGGLDIAIDCDGRFVKRTEYGKFSAYGWEMDHIKPSVVGGLDIYANKRPRHWQGNRSAGGVLGSIFGTKPRDGFF